MNKDELSSNPEVGRLFGRLGLIAAKHCGVSDNLTAFQHLDAIEKALDERVPKVEWLTLVPDIRDRTPYHASWVGAIGRIVFTAKGGAVLEIVYAPNNRYFKPSKRREDRLLTIKDDQLRPAMPEEIEAVKAAGATL